MSLTASLNTALSGLGLTARRAEILASNVASADTPGYARRRLSTDGTVQGTQVLREVDPALQQMRRDAGAEAAGAAITAGFASALDMRMGDPDRPGSLQALLARFDAALTVAAADPTSLAGLASGAAAAEDLVDGLTGLADLVIDARQGAEARIADGVARLGSDLALVADLNADIRRLEVLGQDPSDLRDRRASIVDRISEAVPVRQLPRDHGEVALVSHGGVILLDGSPAEIGFSERAFVEPDQAYPADLSGLTVDGRAVGTGRDGDGLAGGSLGALFDLRDRAAPEAMARLDAIALELAQRFQDGATDPSLSATEPGLFTDRQARVGTAPDAGLAARLQVNDLLASDGPERLRDGFGAAAPAAPASNAQLLRFSDALAARTAPLSGALGSAPADLTDLGGRLRSALSSDRLAAQDASDGADLTWQRLVDLRDGGAVDIDEEMRRLLAVEQAYAANARLIQAVGQMMDRVTEI